MATAQGRFTHEGAEYRLTDLPGIYSLTAKTPEEQVAWDYISSAPSTA